MRLIIAILVMFALAGAEQSHAEVRVALVLGNGGYENAVKLPNAAADAEAMAALLKTQGFDVVLGTNLSRDQMAEKLGVFSKTSAGADVALFFYAGHGMQLAGRNYIVPVDANLASELDVKMRTIDVESVLQDTMGDAKVKLVLLDACRDNPFAKQMAQNAPKTRSLSIGSGLAELKGGEGTLIAFATAPGQVAIDGEGEHSPFTKALLQHLSAPDVEIRHALTNVRVQVQEDTKKQQLPWENTSLTGFFYMNRSAGSSPPTQAAVAPGPEPSPVRQGALELELWSSVKGSNNPDEYQAYVEKFPNGTFADLARGRIASLKAGKDTALTGGTEEIKAAEASSATEDALGLDLMAWSSLQQRLTGLGFSTRGSDGRVGNATRRGIKEWQTARGYTATGYLNRLQHEALLREAVPSEPPATRSASQSGSDTDKPSSRRARTSGGSANGTAAARAMGEFVGGVMRGAVGRRLPF